MSTYDKCPKCGGELVTAKFRGVDNPVLTGMGGFASAMGKCIGAIVEMRCLKCNYHLKRTESYTS